MGVVNFKAWPLYPWERTPVSIEQVTTWSARLEEQKNLSPLPGFEPCTVQHITQSQYRMSYPDPSLVKIVVYMGILTHDSATN